MTKTNSDDEPNYAARKGLILIGSGIVSLFLVGVLAGFAQATLSHGAPSATDIAVILALILIIGGILFAAWKLWRQTLEEPVGPSVKQSRKVTYALVVMSVLLGVGFALAEGPSDASLFSNGPISPITAAFSLFAWLILVPALSWMWWRSVDEHEASAYRDSSAFIANFYMILTPSWWLASRAGWVPEQDPMIVLGIICVVWAAVWSYRKYM